MLMGINSSNEIKQINEITDKLLKVIEVDRQSVFKSMTDEEILCSQYIEIENGYMVQPVKDYDSKLAILELQKKLQTTQEALDFIILGGM